MIRGAVAKKVVATKIVASDGSGDFINIQDAIDDLPAEGGVVYIREGTYIITSSITISSDNIVLIGAGASTIVRRDDGLDDSWPLVTVVASDYIQIEKIFFDGNKANQGATAYSGISIDANSNFALVNGCYTEDCVGDGITIFASNNHTIVNNWCRDNDLNGISIDGSYNIISSNHCYNNGQDGIIIYGTLGTTYGTRNIIYGNICDGNTSYGIEMYKGSVVGGGGFDNIISSNICRDNYIGISVGAGYALGRLSRNIIVNNICILNGDGIDVYDGDKMLIANNLCSNNDYDGIYLEGTSNLCNDITISGNVIINNGWNGIFPNNCYRIIIEGNIIEENGEHGIYCNTMDSVISGNIIKDNDVDDTATYDGINLPVDNDNNIISNNRCMDNDNYEINIADASCDKNIVLGNICLGTDHEGAINDAGTATELAHNIVV